MKMKHLFIVHSSITWLVTQKIMENEQLPPADCVILTDRNMPIPPGEYPGFDISKMELYDLKWREIKYFFSHGRQNRVQLKEIDHIISTVCPEEESFHFYLPHHRDLRYWAFNTHPQCKQFFYTEEGTMSYWGTRPHPTIPQYHGWQWEMKRFILTLSHNWYLQNRAPALLRSFYPQHPKYGGAYGLSKLAFPGLPKLHVLPLPFTHLPEWEDTQHVLVFGPYVEFGEFPQKVRLRVTRELFTYFVKRRITNVCVKFHPSQFSKKKNLEQLKALINEYSDRIQFTEIPQEVSLENIAYSSESDFYLVTSSVAIYAALCGNRVISYAQQILKYHLEFQNTLDAVPKNVWKKLEFIEF